MAYLRAFVQLREGVLNQESRGVGESLGVVLFSVLLEGSRLYYKAKKVTEVLKVKAKVRINLHKEQGIYSHYQWVNQGWYYMALGCILEYILPRFNPEAG